MNAYVLTPLARADIFNIWTYIARDNEAAADHVESAIFEACSFASRGPMRGHVRPDLTPLPLRFWTVSRYPNYAIVYRPETIPVQIVAIAHGKRDIRHLLKSRS
jgi:plasmid stabilization system protein ParE